MVFKLIFLIAYICVTVFTSLKIGKSITLSKGQKATNIVLNAFIPMIWFYLISPIIFPKDKIITRDEREKMITEDSSSQFPPPQRTAH